ncbi:MAG: dihydroorotase [Deltaproteobacteria bacterium]|nr:dihydroorotase [Deltaproteobacteria bacterium]
MSVRPTILTGGRVLDPDSGHDGIADVVIGRQGRIKEVGPGLASQADDKWLVVDCAGKWVLPGLVDIHVHFREPGHEYKETIETGCRSAVAGGFTSVACMANTNPVNDTGAVTRFMVDRAMRTGLARVLPIGALSKGLKGEKLAEISDMVDEGAVAISDDGMPVMDAHLMRRGLEYSRIFDVPVSVHEEDSCLAHHGCMNEGPTATRLGLPGIPNAAEDVMVARDIELAALTGGHLHIAHISTAGAVRMVREAQARGLRVTAEAAPHHFMLTDEAVGAYDTHAKMAPPLRSAADRDAVLAGLADGTICAIATDHAPHPAQDKDVEFELAANGIVGLETAWGLTMQRVHDGTLTLMQAVQLLTSGPSECFRLETGTLRAGRPADVTIIDPQGAQTVVPSTLWSRSHNTPFAGWQLPTRVERTIFAGRTVFVWDGERGRVGTDAARYRTR